MMRLLLAYLTLLHGHPCHNGLFIRAENAVRPGKDVVQTSHNIYWPLEGSYIPQLQSIISYILKIIAVCPSVRPQQSFLLHSREKSLLEATTRQSRYYSTCSYRHKYYSFMQG